MKIIFYGTREYDHYYFDVLAADPEYGCEIRFLTANLDADTAPLAQVGIRCLLLRCAGYNNVDLAAAQKCGITVLRVPGYSPEAVAEHAMALAQAANRRICKAYIKVRNNNFALDGLLGYNLYGSSAGIVGTGRIGAAMARICHGFGMTVLAYDQYRNPALDGIVRYVELDELLRMAQYYVDGKPVADKLRSIRFEKSRQKYKSEHDDSLRRFYMAERKLKPHFKDGKLPITAWRRERERLEQEYKDIQTELLPLYADVKKLWAIHYSIYEVQHEQERQNATIRQKKQEIEL